MRDSRDPFSILDFAPRKRAPRPPTLQFSDRNASRGAPERRRSTDRAKWTKADYVIWGLCGVLAAMYALVVYWGVTGVPW